MILEVVVQHIYKEFLLPILFAAIQSQVSIKQLLALPNLFKCPSMQKYQAENNIVFFIIVYFDRTLLNFVCILQSCMIIYNLLTVYNFTKFHYEDEKRLLSYGVVHHFLFLFPYRIHPEIQLAPIFNCDHYGVILIFL